ncbi:MAG: PKD domain-containing protein [Bacteroidetes bacterium]|nr:PKD domain-containing protein [Bacteroidota bacterium]
MANENSALVAPAGMAWFASWHTDTLINLWQADNSHPTIAGSYLTACVFYETIFRKSPLGLSYSPIALQATTDFLQNIAHTTVFDSLANWNIGSFDVKANFSFAGNETTKIYSFNNLSQNFTSYQWGFGDGNFSSSNGTHTYTDTGTYTATLIAFDNCGNSDTSSQIFTIHAITTGINSQEEEAITVYPNPVKDELLISGLKLSSGNNRLEIYDVTGNRIAEVYLQTVDFKLKTFNWQPGIYFLRLGGHTKKLVKL